MAIVLLPDGRTVYRYPMPEQRRQKLRMQREIERCRKRLLRKMEAEQELGWGNVSAPPFLSHLFLSPLPGRFATEDKGHAGRT